MKNTLKNTLQKRQKGQILVFLGLVFIGLVAIIGLAVDLGLVFVAYSRLNRAVDAAALAATGEFKRNYKIEDMRAAAAQLLDLNDVDLTHSEIEVDTCKSLPLPDDPELCPTKPGETLRKLVRIVVKQDVPLYFLSVLGIHTAHIQVKAIAEAASLDIILVLDNSPTMAFNAPRGEGIRVRDPIICNTMDPHGTDPQWFYAGTGYEELFETKGPDGFKGECHPFEEVKWAASYFVKSLDFAYDRLGIVTFNRQAHIGETLGGTSFSGLPLTGNQPDDPEGAQQSILDAINAMEVYTGSGKCEWTTSNKGWKYDPFTDEDILDGDPRYDDPFYPYRFPNDENREPCSVYRDSNVPGNDAYYWNVDCPNTNEKMPPGVAADVSRCTLTNVGGALSLALGALQANYGAYEPLIPFKPASRDESVWVIILISDGRANAAYGIEGYGKEGEPICPEYTWPRAPQCRDKDPYTRHQKNHPNYDADDFARDIADVVVKNSVFTFTIGFGSDLMKYDDIAASAAPNCVPASTTYNMGGNPYSLTPPNPPCSPGQEFLGYLAIGAANKAENYDHETGIADFAGAYYNVGNNPKKLKQAFLDIINKLTTKLTK